MINIGFDNNPIEEYIIDIRDKGQVVKARYAINEDDKYRYVLMGDHYIQISFVLDRYIWIERGNYIEWNGAKFILREDYVPKWKNKYEIEYTLQFDSKEILAQDVQQYYLNQGLEEVIWSLFSDARTHLAIFCQNMNRYFGTNEWVVGTVEPDGMQNISFDNMSAWGALGNIASAFKAEFYFTGTTVHLVKKVSYGSEIEFENEVNVMLKSRSEGEGDKPFTRIVALGSTRNIPANYRQTTPSEGVDAIYQKRLRIPAAKGSVIDAYPNMSPEEVVEGAVIFEDEYPKRIGTISDVTTKEYTDTDEDTGVVTKWNAYRYKDVGLNFKESYILPGQELRVIFQSGKLNGLDFAVKFNPDGYPETDARSQIFEVVRNEDYGAQLPNDIIKPENGDKYILHGFDIQLVSDQYVPAAEQELYDKAVEWMSDNLTDRSVYEYDSMINYFADNSMDLEIGQKIKIIDDSFKSGYRSSRIQGFEKRLINKYQAVYTVGDNAAKSWARDVSESIKELQVSGTIYQATGSDGVYLIKQFDTTTPSDFNAYSSKASNARFLKRDQEDSALKKITFLDGIDVKKGAASNMFGNDTFTSGQFGSGFRMWQANNGQSYAEFDNLMIRREMIVNTLTIAEIKSVGGQILVSLANMYVTKVEERTDSYRCFFETDNGTIPNQFAVDDQAICRKFNGQGLKYYWRRIIAIGTDYIDLSKVDRDGSSIPAEGDEIIQFGNRTNTNRQSAIMISAYGSDAPSIKQYAGVNTYNLTGKEVTVISPAGNKFTGEFTISTNGTTTPIYKDLGLFVNGRTYYNNDRVSHLGSYWVCIVASTVTTPNETSLAWRKDTVGITEINTLRTEYKSDFVVLNDKIASKVSQSDFNTLQGRVTTTESTITQQAGQIQMTVEKVDNLQAGGRNYVLNSKSLTKVVDPNPYSFLPLNLSEGLQPNTQYTLSIGKTEITSGTAVTGFTIIDYNPSTTQGGGLNFIFPVSTNKKSVTFTTGNLPNNGYTLLLYTGIGGAAQNRAMKWTEVQLSKSNMVVDWNAAPEDMQAEIDTKNRTFYADIQPAAPSGGFKTGDLWYKINTVDGCYETYRWNGTTWTIINVNVSKAKQTITDSSITNLVEKTGINSLGSGESLWSKINQTADQITLEIGKIQIGNRNYVLNSNTLYLSAGANSYNLLILRLSEGLLPNTTYTLSIGKTEITSGTTVTRFEVKIYNLSTNIQDQMFYMSVSTTRQSITFTTGNLPNNGYSILMYAGVAGAAQNRAMKWTEVQLSKSNMVVDWNAAPEDMPDIVGSKLSLTNNQISLASTTIKLDGNTIAKSIEAADLKVGSRAGASALEVLTNGTFYAKGSNGANSSLIIDSGTQSISITSPKTVNGNGTAISGTTNIDISAATGGIKLTGNTDISANSSTAVSNSGIFANTAGQGVYAPSLGRLAKASIVGLGWGYVDRDTDISSDREFVAGVYGEASNTSNAPAYGGYFNTLRANGFVLGTKVIKGSFTTSTQLSASDSLVVSLSNVQQNVTLPSDAYQGTVIWFTQGFSGFMRIYPPAGYQLFDDNTPNSYIDVGIGETAMCVCLANETTGGYKIWLLGKFKF